LCERKLGTMLSRRRRERPIVNVAMGEEMRQLRARLDAIYTTTRRAPDIGNVSESENEDVEAEEVAGEQPVEE
jgi:hypothetical protein